MHRNVILSNLLTLVKITELFRTILLNNLSRLLKILGLKYIYILFAFNGTQTFLPLTEVICLIPYFKFLVSDFQ